MTWAFVIRRPELVQAVDNEGNRERTHHPKNLLNCLSLIYPIRSENESQQKGNGHSKTWRRRISHSGFGDYCHWLICFLNHSESHHRMQQVLQSH